MFANTPSTRPLQRVLKFLLNPIVILLRSAFSREDGRRSPHQRPPRRARFEQLEGRLLLSADIAVALETPIAAPDSYDVIEDTPLNVIAPGVLGNDSDAEGDTLTALLVTGPQYGTLALDPTGAFVYTPAANFFGTDSFTYLASDGQHDSAATVTLEVAAENDAPEAPDQVLMIEEDNPGFVAYTDVDDPVSTLSVDIVEGPRNGTVEFVDGLGTYVPNPNFNGPDGFTYKVTDPHGGVATAVVSITVSPFNDAPLAQDDTATTQQGVAVDIDVLANDTDIEADQLSVASVDDPAHGTAEILANGQVRYTPASGFSGSDSFSYQVSDGLDGLDTALVTINVVAGNHAPAFTTAPRTTFVLDLGQTGANRDSVFQVIGGTGQAVNLNSAAGEAVKINFEWTLREACYDNEVGIFRVDDTSGRIGSLRPGDEGYAMAALAAGRGQVIFASGKGAGTMRELTLEAGALYAFYLVQDDTTAHFLACNPQNRLDHGPLAFFSLATANPDGYDHLRANIDASGSFQLSWEDLTNGGDQDFNDVVMKAPNFRLPEPAAYTYAAHATDADGDPVTYELLERPDGASIDAESGLLTWQPTQPGSYHFVLRAKDAGGAFTDQSFDLEVLSPERVLFVKGTECDDAIEISERDGLVRVKINGEIRAYSGVTAIHVDALAGNDKVQLFGLTAQTLVYGGAGNDWIDGSCVSVGQLDLRGDAGDDELRGGAASDYLDGGSGNDKLFGRPGNDVLIGGSGNDIVKGEDGDDTIVLGSGCDSLDGGPGNDPRVSEAEYNLPVIEWNAILASQISVAPGQSSWIADFVNGLALSEAERDPNASIRIAAPQ